MPWFEPGEGMRRYTPSFTAATRSWCRRAARDSSERPPIFSASWLASSVAFGSMPAVSMVTRGSDSSARRWISSASSQMNVEIGDDSLHQKPGWLATLAMFQRGQIGTGNRQGRCHFLQRHIPFYPEFPDFCAKWGHGPTFFFECERTVRRRRRGSRGLPRSQVPRIASRASTATGAPFCAKHRARPYRRVHHRCPCP